MCTAVVFLQIIWKCDIGEGSESDRNANAAILDCYCNDQQAVNCSYWKNVNALSVCLPLQMPHQLVRKVLGRAKTFSNKTHHLVDAKQSATLSQMQYVYNTETIKTTVYNEWNKGLMKRLRQSIADPLWPAHEKRRSRQNAYKALSLPLWSDVEKLAIWHDHHIFTLTILEFSHLNQLAEAGPLCLASPPYCLNCSTTRARCFTLRAKYKDSWRLTRGMNVVCVSRYSFLS